MEDSDDIKSISDNDQIHKGNTRGNDKEEEKEKTTSLRSRRRADLSLECARNRSTIDSQISPDSEGDILGFFDFTPDAVDINGPMGRGFTPYCRIFEVESLRFSELMPHVFIHNQPVSLKVDDMEILPSTLNFFNQCSFSIILHHGSTHWTITRKSRQISSLHNQLRLFKTILKLPAATSEERERRQSIRVQMKQTVRESEEVKENVPGKTKRLVKFPRKSLQRMDRCTPIDVENYLYNLLHHSLLKSHSAVLEFFEISPVSFVRHLGPKLKEGFVKKRSGGASIFACFGGQYKRRWLVLRETCIFCISPKGGSIRTVMLIDSGFQVSHGFRHTRITKGLLISNLSRTLALKCDGEESEKDWSFAIENVKNHYATDFSLPNRHLSFAPVRNSSKARWYVDGAWYMSDVADLIELAQEEIFITDWWLSPDIYMKRPDLTGKQWKVSEVLKKQAAKGVKIFILLYKEVELALGLNSLYSKHNLCQLNSNIKVLRHPDHYKGSLYWAHHEKMVIIDQMHAFVGGIDLCYGRWDDYRHKLVDLGHGGVQNQRAPKNSSLGHFILNTHGLLVDSVPKVSERKNGIAEQKSEIVDTKDDIDFRTEEHFNPIDKHIASKNPSESIRVNNSSSGYQSSNIRINVEYASFDEFSGSVESAESTDVCDSDLDRSSANLNVEEAVPNDAKTQKKEELEQNQNSNFCAKEENSSHINDSANSSSSNHFSSEEDDVFVDGDDNGADVTEKELNIDNVEETNTETVVDPQNFEESSQILNKEEMQRSQQKMAKNLKSVKSLGVDIMEEMKEKKREMKHWTGKKVPGLKRSESFDSEVGLSTWSEEELKKRGRIDAKSKKRLRRKLKRRPKAKGKLTRDSRVSSTGSLIELHKDLSHEEVNSVHLWIGKDYVNWITKDLYDPHIPFNDNINRHETPRMPWHDIALYVEGPSARDAARHFIQRWNAVKSQKTKNNESYPYLIPKTYKPSSFVPSVLEPKHRVRCQVVRSVGNWSGGQSDTERSIYNAYIDTIKKSKHYIYIENQFFISSCSIGKQEVVNSIAYHLFERIHRAYNKGETYRVYIVVPLLPAFEGQIGTPSGVAMQYILHYTYQSIIRGPNSLIGMLKSAGVPWHHYLSICSLRTHDVLEGQLVSELIYVHSKLLIADDSIVIAGSANINDRSLLGHRDSEVDLVIEDEEFIEGVMNGEKYMRGEFAGSLRMYLFSEHLGLNEDSSIDVSDPVSKQFFMRTWISFASRNTKIYDEVFNCIPNDNVKTFADLRKLRNQKSLAKMNPEEAKKKLKRIQGRLVMYPLMFMKDEDLKPGPNRKEFLLPVEMWL